MDIAPSTITVDVGGEPVSVPGVSLDGIVHLVGRFPEMQKLFFGVMPDPARLLEMGGEMAAAIAAAGLGYPGDAKAEARFRSHGVSVQTALLEGVISATMPNGLDPFIESFTRMAARMGLSLVVTDAPVGATPAKPIKLRPRVSQAA